MLLKWQAYYHMEEVGQFLYVHLEKSGSEVSAFVHSAYEGYLSVAVSLQAEINNTAIWYTIK